MRCNGRRVRCSSRSSEIARCAPRLVGISEWISSTMTVSMDASASRAREASIRYNDSGVVIRMSAGARMNRARSRCGVSPVRIATSGTTNVSPRAAATRLMPAIGARRLRSTSTASAFSGETYSTRHRSGGSGKGANIRRSRQARNAARVLPLPVGARTSVDSPRAMAGHPRACAGVGSPNASRNHVMTAGWKFIAGRRNRSRALRPHLPSADCLLPTAYCLLPTTRYNDPNIIFPLQDED